MGGSPLMQYLSPTDGPIEIKMSENFIVGQNFKCPL